MNKSLVCLITAGCLFAGGVMAQDLPSAPWQYSYPENYYIERPATKVLAPLKKINRRVGSKKTNQIPSQFETARLLRETRRAFGLTGIRKIESPYYQDLMKQTTERYGSPTPVRKPYLTYPAVDYSQYRWNGLFP